MTSIKFLVMLAVALAVSSCVGTTGKLEHKKAIEKLVESPASWSTQISESGSAPIKWLESFNDLLMLDLIAEGRANNIDLRVAASNMEKAWLLAKKSGAALKPTADLSVNGAQSGSADGGASTANVSVGVQVSWELDVWGRIGAGTSAAEARAQAAEADYVFAQHSLSASIAKTYFKVIESKLQVGVSRSNVTILEEMMRITRVKYDNGMSSAQDVALNRANLASAQDQLIAVEGSERDAARALEVLLGRYPNATLEVPNQLPKMPESPPAGIPSDLLERRPDMVAADRQIASAFDAVDQAKAAQLPKFSLTSTISGASSSLSDVLSPSNVAWQLASNLLAPLFDGGKRKLDVAIATLEQQQAVSNYASKALTAFSEVEANLDQGRVLADRKVTLVEFQAQSNKAYRIAKLRYKEGESDLLDTLQIQQKSVVAESNLLSIKRNQLEQRVNLYLSLGGSW